MYKKFKGFVGRRVPIRLIATVLVAILIPSLLLTTLGLVSVYQADRFVKESVSGPYRRELGALVERLGALWGRRLDDLCASIPETRGDLRRLATLRDDPFVADVLASDGERLLLVPSGRPPRVVDIGPYRKVFSRAFELEVRENNLAAAREEYLSRLAASTRDIADDALMLESLLGAARVCFRMRRLEESRRYLEEALALFGDTVDLTEAPRGILILQHLLRVQAELDPEGCRQTARRLAGELAEATLPDPTRQTLLSDLLDFLSAEEIAAAARGREASRSAAGAARIESRQLPELEKVFVSPPGESKAVSGQSRQAVQTVRLAGSGSVTVATFAATKSDLSVHVVLDRDEFLSEAAFQLEDAGLDPSLLRWGWVEGGLLERQEPLAGAEKAVAAATLPDPLSSLELRYFLPLGSLPQGFRSFEVITLATFTWAVIVLVLTIIVGVFLTLRAVLREMQTARLKSDFVSFIGHELKTPLASIRMFAETLLDGRVRDDEERRTCLELIDQESDRLSQLIEKVLEYSRLERHQKVFQFTSCSMEDLVHEAVRLFQEHNHGQPREIEVTSVQRISKTRMDRAAMVELLLNLLSNAAKYSPASKKIAVNVRETMDDISVEVIDQGVGIRKREQKRIFEEFYRGDDYLTREVEGTGLGLTFARYIARVHGGDIKVSSALNAGSTFTLQVKKTHVLAE